MAGRTRIKLPWQTTVSDDVDLNNVSLKNLVMPEDKSTPEPTSPLDVINRQYVEGIVGAPGGGAKIGEPEDGTYEDGLFKDFNTEFMIGHAVDRFNEVLKALAPEPAPNLSYISIFDSGVTGKLSFGDTNTITGYTNDPSEGVGSVFGDGSSEVGIFGAGTVINGRVADNVSSGGANNRPYPADAFGDGDQGLLHLEVNGAIVHTVDLKSFGSGNSLNANGSGFNLTSHQPIKFDSGDPLELFRYRTGTWTVNPTDQRNGYNTVRVRQEIGGTFRDTNSYEWIIDADTTATTFSGETLSNPSPSGSRDISGVTYHTGGTLEYGITISNAYRNTYSRSSSALNFSGVNVSPTDQALPTPNNESDDVVISGKSVSINTSSRLLNESASVNVTVDRTIQGDATSPGQSISGFLIDAISDNANATTEHFNGESYRMHTGLDVTNLNYGSGPNASFYDWDSSQNLMNGDSNHNTGLLISGGRLSYPSSTGHISNIAGGDFGSAALGPGGNPDYSTASGNRTYIRYFHSNLSYSNFRFNVQATGTNFVTVATGPSGNNLTFEILAPNTTRNNGGTIEWKDAVEPHNANDRDVGCFASTFGDTIPTNWGVTLGAENTSTSGNVILVRITAAQGWTGNIDSITITWL